MSFRAIVLGMLLGLAIAAGTYFNDHVIGQTFLIGNNFPACVFGVGLVLLLALNPILRLGGRRMPLRPGEVAVILSMGLAVCAWPGENLMRTFPQLMTLPGHTQRLYPVWKASHVMSYVPGGSPLLAEGFVRNWDALLDDLRQSSAAETHTPAGQVWAHLDDAAQRIVRTPTKGSVLTLTDRTTILNGLNDLIEAANFYDPTTFAELTLPAKVKPLAAKVGHGLSADDMQRLNRAVLDAMWPKAIAPPPRGSGAILLGGRRDARVTEALVTGSSKSVTPLELPWAAWWPTLRLWIGVVGLTGLAIVCMMLVVHPQWSKHELLPYPTVQVVKEMVHTKPGGFLPAIARSQMFWLAVGLVVLLQGVNGLHAWYPSVRVITRTFDFHLLRSLFPNASRVPGAWGFFSPTIYPAAIGFGYFISTRVATSVGLAEVAWIFMGATLLSFGVPLSQGGSNPASNANLLLFGAWVTAALMILYYGRRYYLRLAAGTLGVRRFDDVPGYAIWATRLGFVCAAGAVYLLCRFGGLGVLMAGLLILLVLIGSLVLARINVETGLFFIQPTWLPATILAGFFGYQGLGPTTFLMLLLASTVLMVDPRSGLSPFIINALGLTDTIADAPPRRSWLPLGAMVVVGLVVALVVTLTIQYNLGLPTNDPWAAGVPHRAFDKVASAILNLRSTGQLAQAQGLTGLAHLTHASPTASTISWAVAGGVLVLLCSIARIRLSWWPIHPVLFLVWGTYPATCFWLSFLLAAGVKTGVTKIGGERAYHRFKPFMIGLIAGDLLMILFWALIGTIYYLNTGLAPHVYRILPG